MKIELRGKAINSLVFMAIVVLVAGGLGWATAEALRLEREQRDQRAETERDNRLRLALWRLDSRVWPLLAREDGRPFHHYSAVAPLPLALDNSGACRPAGTVLEPSPLLNDELPPWMVLHFQTGRVSGWESPQVLSPRLEQALHKLHDKIALTNATPNRRQLLAALQRDLPAATLLRHAESHTQPAIARDTALVFAPNNALAQQTMPEYNSRLDRENFFRNQTNLEQRMPKDVALNAMTANGANLLASPSGAAAPAVETVVRLSPMVAAWLNAAGQEQLVLMRLVRIEEKEICQGIVLDAPALQEMLAREAADLFPEARLTPMREATPPQPERAMTALPLQLDPGSLPPLSEPGWTPLRIGLLLAWLAASLALAAVGLGGWSLLELSERRIRFVSAVTHELRTPLTTLRLYLDMLLQGMVRDEGKRDEYLRTLNDETDRLHRLVGNVLAFSRLENRRPRLHRVEVVAGDLLEQVRSEWASRCHNADKELIVENHVPAEARLRTDGDLLRQVLGNLLDNACKYSRGAADRRVWLRARREGHCMRFEIADRGPGVSAKDRRSIFRAFRRGRGADETAGGVGLGLALARRWTQLLGGRLTLQHGAAECGACFRVELTD
jgi:signal transduction histidine kinase